MRNFSESERYLIWSNQRRRWWGPDRSGYVKRIRDAGRYTESEALEICAEAMTRRLGDKTLPELPVSLELVTFMMQRVADTFPGRDPEPPGDDGIDVDKAKALKSGFIPLLMVAD